MERIRNEPNHIYPRFVEFRAEYITNFIHVIDSIFIPCRTVNNNNSTLLSFIPTIRDMFTSFFSTWKPKSFETMDVDTDRLFQQFGNITHAAMIVDALYRVFSLLHTILKVVSRGELHAIQIGKTRKQNSPSFWNSITSLFLALLPTLFITGCIVYVPFLNRTIEFSRSS